ncbi:hypothetical protein Gasu2_19830 [Galdieria sulphuraria]|uniref:Uncharacterized protein n=1 Tax=Galdieria sulphuraria TaxID=130081 RepID=M2Y5T9_GALSU|nr:uncharacterized protein Gasu_14670 [Galdieria sulphuraria]EME31224.1 hypothetical protein Gasu_14670 [Galdieria sulphuraria]GJD07634.1 hypothetical protein Gasu2_19830 [Galdieria sulphuraria]|eukprot:XP_005707744.1 hypothetical protein Gasu_14670 [Galdieria sulphuraria]
MSFRTCHNWFPLCLLLKETNNDISGEGIYSSRSELFQQPLAKETQRWSTGPSFVKHYGRLKRHSLPAVHFFDNSQSFLQNLQPNETFPETTTLDWKELENATRLLNDFMESASEDGDSLFDDEFPTMHAKTKLQDGLSTHPQSPPSDITQSVLSNTQSPVPSMLSETELPDFGEDFVNANEELWSSDDWKYFQVEELLLQSWRRCLRLHNERFAYDWTTDYDNDRWKLIDVRQVVID